MLRPILNSRNAFFDTYYIYDDEKKTYIGVIEDHCRKVARRYYVGWKFKGNDFIPNTFQSGKTEPFYAYEEAINYILQKDF